MFDIRRCAACRYPFDILYPSDILPCPREAGIVGCQKGLPLRARTGSARARRSVPTVLNVVPMFEYEATLALPAGFARGDARQVGPRDAPAPRSSADLAPREPSNDRGARRPAASGPRRGPLRRRPRLAPPAPTARCRNEPLVEVAAEPREAQSRRRVRVGGAQRGRESSACRPASPVRPPSRMRSRMPAPGVACPSRTLFAPLPRAEPPAHCTASEPRAQDTTPEGTSGPTAWLWSSDQQTSAVRRPGQTEDKRA